MVKAKVMWIEGIDVFSFIVGELDFIIFFYIVEVVKLVLDEGKICYGFVVGELVFCQAIVKKLWEKNNLFYEVVNILVINGGKYFLFNLMLVMIEQGDEVIIFVFYWFSYLEMVCLVEGILVIVNIIVVMDYKIILE